MPDRKDRKKLKRPLPASEETEMKTPADANEPLAPNAAADTHTAPVTDSAGASQPEPAEPTVADQDATEAAPSLEERLRQERDQFEERWLRTAAELDNYRKRMQKELQDVRRFTLADLMRKLLEVVDNLERALQFFLTEGDRDIDPEAIHTGIAMVHQHLQEILAEQGVQIIEAENAEFDPRLHEAIQQMTVAGVPTGQIAEVVQTGYKLDDLVLRPSRVIVAE